MEIQVIFSDYKFAFKKGQFIKQVDYRFCADDYDDNASYPSVTFLEDNCPEQVADDIAKDLVNAGLVARKDFQIVIWQ